MALSLKKQRFVEEFLVDLCASAAAIRAGYSVRSARQVAHVLMADKDVEDAVERGKAELSRRTNVTSERVIRELANIAFYDPDDIGVWGPDGVILHDSTTLTPMQRKLVIKIKTARTPEIRERKTKYNPAGQVLEVTEKDVKPGVMVSVDLADRTKALDKLGQYLGLWPQGEVPADTGAAAERIRAALREMEKTVGTALDATGSDTPDAALDPA
jgi:phage terminase small subunit